LTLKEKVTSSVFWVGVSMVGARGLSFIVQIVLARILVPEYFGLISICALVMDALRLFSEMGFSSALIYRKDRVREASDVTFLAAIGTSFVLYGVAFVIAPLVGQFFRMPEVPSVLRVLSIVMVINSVGQVPFVLLARELDFRRRLVPDLVPALGYGLVAISLALSGMGVWSLVVGRIAEAILRVILVWWVVPWRPNWTFDWDLAKEMFAYGRHIIASKILIFGITNVDDTFVGRMTGAAGLGYYGLAYNLSNLPATQITRLVNQIMFPALSQLQDDLQRMRRAFFQLWGQVGPGHRAHPVPGGLRGDPGGGCQHGERLQSRWQTPMAHRHRPVAAGYHASVPVPGHQVLGHRGRQCPFGCGGGGGLRDHCGAGQPRPEGPSHDLRADAGSDPADGPWVGRSGSSGPAGLPGHTPPHHPAGHGRVDHGVGLHSGDLGL